MKKFLYSLLCVLSLTACTTKTVEVKSCPFPETKAESKETVDGDVSFILPRDFSQYKEHVWTSKSRNMIVVVIENKTDLSQDKYVEEEVSNLEMDSDIEIVINEPVNVKGKTGRLVVFRTSKVYIANVLVVHNGLAHHVGCGGLFKEVEKTLPVCADIITSVTVK